MRAGVEALGRLGMGGGAATGANLGGNTGNGLEGGEDGDKNGFVFQLPVKIEKKKL